MAWHVLKTPFHGIPHHPLDVILLLPFLLHYFLRLLGDRININILLRAKHKVFSLSNFVSSMSLQGVFLWSFLDQRWEQLSFMFINIRSKRFDGITILLVHDSRFYANTHDFPSHCLLTMVTEPGRKLPLVKQTLHPIRKQLVTPEQWCHYCSCSLTMSGRSALQPIYYLLQLWKLTSRQEDFWLVWVWCLCFLQLNFMAYLVIISYHAGMEGK